jgi:hypothetical protein
MPAMRKLWSDPNFLNAIQKTPSANPAAAQAPAGATSAGDAPADAAAPQTSWADLASSCDKYLTDHRFKAVQGEEIVPGDMVCDMYLDDHLLELRATTGTGQAQARAALVKALPDLKNFPVDLAHLIADRWDIEVKKALMATGKIPNQPLPIGVLRRKADGNTFWQPNLAQGTWGDVKAPTSRAWISDFLDFYNFGPPNDSQFAAADGCMFNGEGSNVAAVLDTMSEQANLANFALDQGTAKSVAQSKATKPKDAPAEQPTGAPGKAGKGPEVSLDLIWSVVPRTDHVALDPDPSQKKPVGDPSHDKPGGQMQYNVNVQFKNGVTLTWACQLTVFQDSDGNQTYKVQNILAGPQVAIDATPKFLDGILEIDPIAQALAGHTRQQVGNTMKLVPTAQVAVGVQIQHKFKLPGTKMKLVVTGQIAGSVTDPRGAVRTADFTSLLGLGVEW